MSAPFANDPLVVVDPNEGYRPNIPGQHRDAGHLYLIVAFSGGGTRAAALAYGVLEELRDTEVVIRGERKRMLDKVQYR